MRRGSASVLEMQPHPEWEVANLQKAYKAFTELYDDEDALSEIYEECDNVFYDNEGEVEALLKEYARTMQV